MNLDALRGGDARCPSDLQLDRLHANELPPAEARQLQSHAASCAHCAARLEERRAGFASLKGIDERRVLAAIRRGLDAPPRARPFAWLFSLRFALAASAVAAMSVLLGVAPRARRGAESASDVEGAGQVESVRGKGGLALHVFRLRDGRAEEAVSGDRFAPGDRLRFEVDLPRDGAVRVLGVESSGALYLAWPLDPAAPTQLKAGAAIALPGAVALDSSLGRETLYALQCPSAESASLCKAASGGGKPSCPAGCQLSPFVLEKTTAENAR